MVGRHRDRRTALRVWAKALSSSKLCRPDCATVPRKGRERVVGKTRPLRPCCALPGRRSPASRISWAPRAPLPSIRINSPGTRSFRWTTSGVSPTAGSGLLLTSIGISSAPINTRPTSPGCQRLYAAFGNGCPGRHAAGTMALRGRAGCHQRACEPVCYPPNAGRKAPTARTASSCFEDTLSLAFCI